MEKMPVFVVMVPVFEYNDEWYGVKEYLPEVAFRDGREARKMTRTWRKSEEVAQRNAQWPDSWGQRDRPRSFREDVSKECSKLYAVMIPKWEPYYWTEFDTEEEWSCSEFMCGPIFESEEEARKFVQAWVNVRPAGVEHKVVFQNEVETLPYVVEVDVK